MFKKPINTQIRSYLTHNPGLSVGEIQLEKRPAKKIGVGKARPAIYYKFDSFIQLSDGSVIKRRTQFPKDQIKLINDQRNNPLWNPSRDDLTQFNAKGAGRLSKFKQKYSLYEEIDEAKEEKKQDDFSLDDYLSLVGENVKEVQSGGILKGSKKKSKKK